MRYKIELKINTVNGVIWSRSWSYPHTYTKDEARALIACVPQHEFRIVTVRSKPYRRHAAVTPLELRGAHRMLSSARNHVCDSVSIGSQEGFAAFQILSDALLRVTRALESL
jgi:hypothetical protein